MSHELILEIQSQPSDTACGPTCLAAVYDYWQKPVDLNDLLGKISELNSGGTLAVDLACDALNRGFAAEIVTYNLQLFDPTWFDARGEMKSGEWLTERLTKQLDAKQHRGDFDVARLASATKSYLQFLSLGGRVQMQPLDELFLVSMMARETPILCGLSSTYLYQESRETPMGDEDDIGGDPTGHFVVLHGFDPVKRTVLIADPLHPNPMAPTNKYVAPLSRVTSAILLGIVTFDANLLTVFPKSQPKP
ncbi:hypothetical protein [Rubripirellula obstinata]|uniref:hypothetical protein n=1 Tax=Rubripirellula obstinata TaxID=406547 RepID=UPI0009FF2FB8|nr:hypothetical protein [Rubripirellula obstinata]